jgi:hypothetical protein
MSCSEVIYLQTAIIASRPNYVIVYRVRDGPSTLTSSHGMPKSQWNAALTAIAWSSVGITILTVSIDIIWDLIVCPHMVHLCIGKHMLLVGFLFVPSYPKPAVMGN